MFNTNVIEKAKKHALNEWPKEACGFVINDEFFPVDNIAKYPNEDFEIDPKEYLYAKEIGEVQAVIHSHTGGQDCPSKMDMVAQENSDLPWGVIVLNYQETETDVKPFFKEIFWFGDQVPIPDLLGRPFRHGVTDCYALVRDYYWLKKGIRLPNFPRQMGWWEEPNENLLEDNFKETNFKVITLDQVKVGDGLMFQILANKINHCGIYVGKGLMLHHLYGFTSRNDVINRYKSRLRYVVRYTE